MTNQNYQRHYNKISSLYPLKASWERISKVLRKLKGYKHE